MSAGRHRQGPVPLVDRPIEPKTRKHHPRWMAGLIAVVATLAMSFALVGGQGQARAALTVEGAIGSITNSLGITSEDELGNLINDIVNNAGSQAASLWRIDLCASGGSSGGADCTGSTGTGIAVVLPGRIELIPTTLWGPVNGLYNGVKILDLFNLLPAALRQPEVAQGTAKVIGSGFQFALASTGGNATAISYLPLSVATAGASGGRTAISFSLIGIANAWTTDDITTSIAGIDVPLLKIPGVQRVDCFGVITAAYAEGVGACANILATFDTKLDLKKSQLQLGLTNPAGLLDSPTSIFTELIESLLTTGNLPGLSTLLTEDFGRLYLGGDQLLGLTSDYGFDDPVTVNWLGQKLTLFPKMTAANLEQRPNYLGLPTFTPGALDPAAILPSITSGPFKIPFIDSPLNPTNLTSTSDGNTTTLASARSSATSLAAPVEEVTPADETTTDEAPIQETTEPADTATVTKTTKSGDGFKTWQQRQREKFAHGGTSGSKGSILDRLRKHKKSKDSTSDNSTTGGTTDSSTDAGDDSSSSDGTDGTTADGTTTSGDKTGSDSVGADSSNGGDS